jgi:hypothetical protein
MLMIGAPAGPGWSPAQKIGAPQTAAMATLAIIAFINHLLAAAHGLGLDCFPY